jgi:hypothetical protein
MLLISSTTIDSPCIDNTWTMPIYAKLGITHFGIEIAALFWHEFKALCPKLIVSHVIVFFFPLKVGWV